MVGEILLREGSRRTSRVEEEETLQGQKEGDEVGRIGRTLTFGTWYCPVVAFDKIQIKLDPKEL